MSQKYILIFYKLKKLEAIIIIFGIQYPNIRGFSKIHNFASNPKLIRLPCNFSGSRHCYAVHQSRLILIIKLSLLKGYTAKKLLKYFPSKKLEQASLRTLLIKFCDPGPELLTGTQGAADHSLHYTEFMILLLNLTFKHCK